MPENSVLCSILFAAAHVPFERCEQQRKKTDAFKHRRKSYQKMHFSGTQLLCAPCGTAWYWLMIAAESAKVPEGSVPIRRCIQE